MSILCVEADRKPNQHEATKLCFASNKYVVEDGWEKKFASSLFRVFFRFFIGHSAASRKAVRVELKLRRGSHNVKEPSKLVSGRKKRL